MTLSQSNNRLAFYLDRFGVTEDTCLIFSLVVWLSKSSRSDYIYWLQDLIENIFYPFCQNFCRMTVEQAAFPYRFSHDLGLFFAVLPSTGVPNVVPFWMFLESGQGQVPPTTHTPAKVSISCWGSDWQYRFFLKVALAAAVIIAQRFSCVLIVSWGTTLWLALSPAAILGLCPPCCSYKSKGAYKFRKVGDPWPSILNTLNCIDIKLQVNSVGCEFIFLFFS